MESTSVGFPAWWPAALIAGGIYALIMAFIWGRDWLKRRRCLHLHPDLVESADGADIFRCLDCGGLTVELQAD